MNNSYTIVLSGQAGQGLQTIENIIDKILKENYYVFSSKEVMSRVRGGNNTVEIRISDHPIYAYQDGIDMLFLLNKNALYRITDRIHKDTYIFGETNTFDPTLIPSDIAHFHELSVSNLAKQSGSLMFQNTVLLGYIAGLLQLPKESAALQISKYFSHKEASIIDGNVKAFHAGYDEGASFFLTHRPFEPIPYTDAVKNHKILNGTEAIAIGALAGGVNYSASYPMSPGTAVLEYLAKKGEDFGVLVEQAEDEIAAINMTIGAWYAGARGIVTTSGGGFALMEEGVSLSGITETPCVIHIGQRPGPGTGLPTRTEQADLNLVVYAGHGEFPRIVLAPGSLEDGVILTQKAFYLADRYQVPVFILSDTYYLDSKSTIRPLELSDEPLRSFVVPSEKDYLRYRLTDSPISPRSIPGYGEGLVKCDSDEHDERGAITEDFQVRVQMNEKRLAKEALLLEDYIEPELIGAQEYDTLVIGWGSTYGVLKEGVELLNTQDPHNKIAFLHIKEVFPLHPSLSNFTKKAKKIVLFENNAGGQLKNLLKLYLDVKVDQIYLKYNGVPFTTEEVYQKLTEVLS